MCKKVFCKNCKWYVPKNPYPMAHNEDKCDTPCNRKRDTKPATYYEDAHTIVIGHWDIPEEKNKNNNCEDYEPLDKVEGSEALQNMP